MKTYQASNTTITNQWYLIDASGRTLGRLATEVARRLRGKHKPEYTPHVDTGDFIVVVNVEKIKISGNKAQDKKYYNYSGYQSGLKERTFDNLVENKPERLPVVAVKGMLPKNPLGRAMLKKLKIYSGAEHPHQAQMPEVIDAKYLDSITGEG